MRKDRWKKRRKKIRRKNRREEGERKPGTKQELECLFYEVLITCKRLFVIAELRNVLSSISKRPHVFESHWLRVILKCPFIQRTATQVDRRSVSF